MLTVLVFDDEYDDENDIKLVIKRKDLLGAFTSLIDYLHIQNNMEHKESAEELIEEINKKVSAICEKFNIYEILD